MGEYQDHHEEKYYLKGQACQEKKEIKEKKRKKDKDKEKKKKTDEDHIMLSMLK